MSNNKLLLVDDDLGTIKVMSRVLANVGDVQFATNAGDAFRLIHDAPPALILLDAQMPGLSGFDFCALIKRDPNTADIPVIFVTAHNDTASEVAGLDIGAVDFIAKPISEPLLLARVKTQLRIKNLTDDLRRLSTIDGLTNVLNRRSFDQSLRREWDRARRSGGVLSLLMIDVDHFKLFNDQYGHPAGDTCLQAVAKALEHACLRPADLVARYGGEEFALLLPQTPRTGAEHVAARILLAVDALAIPHSTSPTTSHVTVSVGVSSYDEESEGWGRTSEIQRWPGDGAGTRITCDLLLQAADRALYQAKQSGRACAKMLDISDNE